MREGSSRRTNAGARGRGEGRWNTSVRTAKNVWEDLSSSRSRFMGTPHAERALATLQKHMSGIGLQPRFHDFEFLGWSPGARVDFAVDTTEVEAYAMLPTVGGCRRPNPCAGQLAYIGRFGIWGNYDWHRFAIVSKDGALLAYVLGREKGKAIPQALPEGTDQVPYVGIGAAATRRLMRGLAASEPLFCRLRTEAAMQEREVGRNLVVDLPNRGSKRILIGAHYDSQYSTPGAYDNAGGAACLAGLAACYRDGIPGVSAQLVWFGAEEWLLQGSKAYVSYLRESSQLPDLMVNLDGVGRGEVLDVWYGPDRLLPPLKEAIDHVAAQQAFTTVYVFPPPPGSDHAPFYDAGCAAFMLTFNDLQILHRPEDVIDTRKFDNMKRILTTMNALLSSIGPLLNASEN